jgi:hypothetical protein
MTAQVKLKTSQTPLVIQTMRVWLGSKRRGERLCLPLEDVESLVAAFGTSHHAELVEAVNKLLMSHNPGDCCEAAAFGRAILAKIGGDV